MREAVRRLKSRDQIPNSKHKKILFHWGIGASDYMGNMDRLHVGDEEESFDWSMNL